MQSIHALDEAPQARVHQHRRFYQPELDGLRFYAFAGVFVCHTLPVGDLFYRRLRLPIPWLWAAVVRSGGEGVDLFFALSAFLITSLLLSEREQTGGISLRRFYIRRALRIWPLYFLVVALGVVFAHTGPDRGFHWFYYQRLPVVLYRRLRVCSSETGYTLFSERRSRSALRCGRCRSRSSSICFGRPYEEAQASRDLNRWDCYLPAFDGKPGRHRAGCASNNYISFGSASRFNSLAVGIMLALRARRVPTPPTGSVRFLLVAGGLIAWIGCSTWFTDQTGPASMRAVLVRLISSLASGAILYDVSIVAARFLRVTGWCGWGRLAMDFTCFISPGFS